MLRKTHRGRLLLLFVPPLAIFVILAVRLHFVQVAGNARYARKARFQHSAPVSIRPKRGSILTADGEELAFSTPAYAVYAETALIKSGHRALARQLAPVLGKSALRLEARLRSGKVVSLARRLEPWRKERLEEIKRLNGLSKYALRFEEEGRRHYPHGSLASHVVGYAGLDEFGDNRGLDGAELRFDAMLRGETSQGRVSRDAAQKSLGPVPEEPYKKAFGDSLVLTINASIQHAAEVALRERCVELEAVGGAVVVTEVKTGRVLAMASWPDFSPGRFYEAGAEELRNRCVSFAYEPGSVMKIVTFSWLMREGLVNPWSEFDCEGGHARINGRRIRDSGSHMRVVPVRDIFKKSSNVGTNKAAALMEGPRFLEGIKRFGLGEPTGIELPGESAGFVPNLSDWSGFTMTSLPMGYELRVTPIQIAQAVGAVANGGVMMKPWLVEEARDGFGEVVYQGKPEAARRVIDPRSSAWMLHMMEAVVTEGTGKNAALPGYRVGGKTGTTRKYDVKAGDYASGKYYASFCGVFPLSDPEILIFAMVDEPDRKFYGGGSASAPIFSRVAEEVARVRAIEPDAPIDPEEESPEARSLAAPAFDPGGATPIDELPEEADDALDDLGGLEPAWKMPDLSGLTMAEARDILAGMPAGPLEFAGSGVVADQRPSAGRLLPKGAAVSLAFDMIEGAFPPEPAPEQPKLGE